MNSQLRNAAKSLWGLSKHAKNDLNRYFELHDLTKAINTRKLKLLQQLMRNETSKHYLLTALMEGTSPTISHITDICSAYGLNVPSILLGNGFELGDNCQLEFESNEIIHGLLLNWNLNKKEELRIFLESNIIRS